MKTNKIFSLLTVLVLGLAMVGLVTPVVADWAYDNDRDGYKTGGNNHPYDCDDTNSAINPGADEVCDDDVDNDCDGLIDGNDPDCQQHIPEFATIALPVASVLGLLFFFNHRKRRKE